jgi:hypothetical protein
MYSYRAMTYNRAHSTRGYSFDPSVVVDHRYTTDSKMAMLGLARAVVLRHGRDGDKTVHWLVLRSPDGARQVVRADATGDKVLQDLIEATSKGMVEA